MLERWSRRPKSPHSIAQRSRIVLLAADGLTNNAVAERVGVSRAPTCRWGSSAPSGEPDREP